jgi:hypothetical protein
LPGSVTVGAGGGGGTFGVLTVGVLTVGGFGALPVEGTGGGLGVLGTLGTLGVLTLGTVGVTSEVDGTVGVTSEVDGRVGVETVGVCGSEVVGALGSVGTATAVGVGFTLGTAEELVWVWLWADLGFGVAVLVDAVAPTAGRAGAPEPVGAGELDDVGCAAPPEPPVLPEGAFDEGVEDDRFVAPFAAVRCRGLTAATVGDTRACRLEAGLGA